MSFDLAPPQPVTITGEIDRVTVSQLRLRANRVLDALARPSSAGAARVAALGERELLIQWLDANGLRALTRCLGLLGLRDVVWIDDLLKATD